MTEARPRWNYLLACVEARQGRLTPDPGARGRIDAWGALLGQETAALCDARWSSLRAMWGQVMRADTTSEQGTDWDELGRLLGERGDRFATWLECTEADLIGLLDRSWARMGAPA